MYTERYTITQKYGMCELVFPVLSVVVVFFHSRRVRASRRVRPQSSYSSTVVVFVHSRRRRRLPKSSSSFRVVVVFCFHGRRRLLSQSSRRDVLSLLLTASAVSEVLRPVPLSSACPRTCDRVEQQQKLCSAALSFVGHTYPCWLGCG